MKTICSTKDSPGFYSRRKNAVKMSPLPEMSSRFKAVLSKILVIVSTGTEIPSQGTRERLVRAEAPLSFSKIFSLSLVIREMLTKATMIVLPWTFKNGYNFFKSWKVSLLVTFSLLWPKPIRKQVKRGRVYFSSQFGGTVLHDGESWWLGIAGVKAYLLTLDGSGIRTGNAITHLACSFVIITKLWNQAKWPRTVCKVK